MPVPHTVDTANALPTERFIGLLADVFEHSPWVAERVAGQRPFSSVDALHAAMVQVVRDASLDEQLGLLRSHPELAGREAQRGELTASSGVEQARAGLNALSKDELAHIMHLNAAYMALHGFPFIVCVGRHTKQSIFGEFERRLGQPTGSETQEALAQVALIARLRLDAMFAH